MSRTPHALGQTAPLLHLGGEGLARGSASIAMSATLTHGEVAGADRSQATPDTLTCLRPTLSVDVLMDVIAVTIAIALMVTVGILVIVISVLLSR